MRRFSTGRRHTRPVAVEVPVGPPPGGTPDDLTTWSNSAFIETKTLPGTATDRYELAVDVTNIIDAGAVADTGALRFVRSDGVMLGHYRTASNRILLVGRFIGGIKNRINYYWGKSGAEQPGTGFPTHAEMMAPYRLALIFDGGVALDFSNNPAPFTVVGSPTIQTGKLGQAMKFAEGSYIETTASKLRADARDKRSIFALTHIPDSTSQGRVLCWANWLTGQRALQFWVTSQGILELYISDNGETFIPWRMEGVNRTGWNTIGATWEANKATTIMLLNENAQEVESSFTFTTPPGQLFNSNDPYIVGGTKVPGAYHNGMVECKFELFEPMSLNGWLAWSDAWNNNDVFWGKADRTPNSIDVPNVTNAPINSEVSFARKEITGISPDTPVSVAGDGDPTYSLGSTFDNPTDIKAKGNTAGLAKNGDWLSTYHTTPSTNSTVTESSVTVGTVTSPRKSTTVAAASSGGGSGIPSGTPTVTVTSLSALKNAISAAKGGDIIEIAEGDYKPQGQLSFSNKDFRSYSQPLVIRASRRAYRGYMPTQGGLWVSGETNFRSGSGGAEFNGGLFRNIHNIVFDGIRFYTGPTDNTKYYAADFGGCSYLTFQYCKFSGAKPQVKDSNGNWVETDESTWAPYKGEKPYPNGWGIQSRGINLGRSLDRCDYITFRHCMWHYFGMQMDFAGTRGCIMEDCVLTDSGSDHIRNDGGQDDLIIRRCIIYRQFPQQGTGPDVSHPDAVQNTTKTQPGWRRHVLEDNIVSIGDGAHGKMQGFFYECDNYPEYPRGFGNRVRRCIMHSPTINTIYFRPADDNRVEYTTVLANMSAAQAPDSQQQINFTAPILSGKSFGNNAIYRCVTDTTATAPGDDTTGTTRLLRSEYEAQLVHYPGSWMKSGFTPIRVLNPYTGVLNLTHLGYMAPKASSRVHPNQTGYHIGASQLFQNLGVLP